MKAPWSIFRLLVLAGFLAIPGQAAPPPQAAEVEAVMRQASGYTIEGSREALAQIEAFIRQSRPGDALRHQIERQLVTALGRTVTADARGFICRSLWMIGTDRSIPVLERMLLSPETTHLACYALLNFPSKTADTALRRALDHCEGSARMAVINTLGDRRDARAVPQFGELARGQDLAVAEAAAVALGRIGGFAAADTLERLRRTAPEALKLVMAQALIQCAQRFAHEGEPAKATALYQRLFQEQEPIRIRQAALIGLIGSAAGSAGTDLALRMVNEPNPTLRAVAIAQIPALKDPNATRRFAGILAGAGPERQVLLIDALSQREDPAARPALEALMRETNSAVSLAAIRAVGRFAEAASATALLQLASSAPSADQLNAALAALRQLSGNSVNEAVVKTLKATQGPLRIQLIDLLADRRAVGAVPVLLEAAASPEVEVAKAAFRALASVCGPAQVEALVTLLTTLKHPGLSVEAELAVTKAAQQIQRTELRTSAVLAAYKTAGTSSVRLALLRVLGGMGGAGALEEVQAATQAEDPALREAAARLLATWPDATAVKPLLKLAAGTQDPTLRMLMVRGVLRLLGEAENLPSSERLAAYRAAMELGQGAEEKRLALSVLAEAPFPGALELVHPLIGDPEVNAEACLAALRIARVQLNTQKDPVKTALDKVVQSATDEKLKEQARELLRQVQ